MKRRGSHRRTNSHWRSDRCYENMSMASNFVFSLGCWPLVLCLKIYFVRLFLSYSHLFIVGRGRRLPFPSLDAWMKQTSETEAEGKVHQRPGKTRERRKGAQGLTVWPLVGCDWWRERDGQRIPPSHVSSVLNQRFNQCQKEPPAKFHQCHGWLLPSRHKRLTP